MRKALPSTSVTSSSGARRSASSEQLLQRGPLRLPIARLVFAEVCAAVAELHDRDLVHRDLKPANIMVGTDGAIIVTDFGLACPRPAAGAHGPIAGTVAYMAPEMFKGDISARTDVYAIGVLAWLHHLGWFFAFILLPMNVALGVLWCWQRRADRRFLALC